jgi:ribonuclease G
VAIVEDDQLVELLVDSPEARRSVGDIYVGKVEAVLPGIQAAFVDIGAEKSAFLHASDLIEAEEDDLDEEPNGDEEADKPNGGKEHESRRGGKLPPIQDLLKRGQTILVQVSKEPIGTKGPRVTAQVSIPGRFLVYMPTASPKVGVSRKIESREPSRGRPRSSSARRASRAASSATSSRPRWTISGWTRRSCTTRSTPTWTRWGRS